MKHSGFFVDELSARNIAASHDVEKDRAATMIGAWVFPRSIDSTGGLVSSAREQTAYMRFHLGDARRRRQAVLTPQSLRQCAPTRPRRHRHYGDRRRLRRLLAAAYGRRRAGFSARRIVGRADFRLLFVPDRQFAMTVLTNSTAAPGSSPNWDGHPAGC